MGYFFYCLNVIERIGDDFLNWLTSTKYSEIPPEMKALSLGFVHGRDKFSRLSNVNDDIESNISGFTHGL